MSSIGLRIGWLGLLLAIVSACPAAQLQGRAPGNLPAPTGRFAIGRVTLLCTDELRVEPLEPHRGPRRLMVDVWYPATSADGTPSEYLNVPAFEQALGTDGLRKQLGSAYGLVRAGVVRTHAMVGAPFASLPKRSAVLIFSPGGGMVKELYAAQLEDLASHGYVVAAITHTYDGFVTVFPDGTQAVYDGKRWPKQPSFEGAANLNQLEWHAGDIRVVLDELGRLNAPAEASRFPFAGRLDLARVGAFGHSFGGIAAARACQKDQRIQACLNQDGAVAMAPFYLDAQGWGMDQPFMLIERAPRAEPPSDQELAGMKVSRSRAAEIVERLKANRDRVLRSTAKGSYLVLLQRAATAHMDFSDLRILGARDHAEMEARERVLTVVRGYTRAFFDKHVRGMDAPVLDRKPDDPIVEAVHKFAPSKRPKRARAD